jgi:hypothetical protein
MLTGVCLAYETAFQVGTQTFGKGIAQTVSTLAPETIVVNGKSERSYYAIYYTFAFFFTPTVTGSLSPYNNYCNQSDLFGNGDRSQPERGYMPPAGNHLSDNNAIFARARVLLA